MRYFLIILALLPFFAVAQDSTVCIKPSTARYYLEVEDEMYLLRGKDTTQQELITNLSEQSLVKDSIIVTYQNDSIQHKVVETTLTTEITYTTEENKELKKSLRKEKLLRNLAILGIIIAAIL